jgi:hypothetical protein
MRQSNGGVASEYSVPSISPAVSEANQNHDRRMIAIGLLFERILCGGFKSRRRLEAEILILRHSAQRARARDRGDRHFQIMRRRDGSRAPPEYR